MAKKPNWRKHEGKPLAGAENVATYRLSNNWYLSFILYYDPAGKPSYVTGKGNDVSAPAFILLAATAFPLGKMGRWGKFEGSVFIPIAYTDMTDVVVRTELDLAKFETPPPDLLILEKNEFIQIAVNGILKDYFKNAIHQYSSMPPAKGLYKDKWWREYQSKQWSHGIGTFYYKLNKDFAVVWLKQKVATTGFPAIQTKAPFSNQQAADQFAMKMIKQWETKGFTQVEPGFLTKALNKLLGKQPLAASVQLDIIAEVLEQLGEHELALSVDNLVVE